ncbi:right-handed parallel beta-helix repeat-containing protein [Haloarchaeobius sp. DFWS5]|uniref:right-handed parallel beta-helix repeat-containing protein n=1 Tax=Haloarchaeobius sp. DFWS5 TaxID=3446114 RepID=UPI003EBBFC5A
MSNELSNGASDERTAVVGGTTEDSTDERTENYSRRHCLQLAGAAGIAAAGLTGTAAAGDRAVADVDVYNVVEEGADPHGNEPIDPVIDDLERDNVTLEFPNGTYLVNSLNFYGRENFTVRGIGDDVTFVPGPNWNEQYWIAGWSMNNFTFENVTLDNSEKGVAPTVTFGCHDGLLVRDVEKVGYHDGNNTAFGFWVLDSAGTGLVENLEMRDGSIPVNPVGVYTGSDGELTYRDCHIEGFGNNGLYASTGEGAVKVEGGVFKNNDRTQVRLGAPGSYVKDAEIIVDDPERGGQNQRGIRLSDNSGPITIENCDIKMLAGRGFGAIVCAFDGGTMHVKDTRIHVEEEYYSYWSDHTAPAIYVDEATDRAQSDGIGERTFENVSITGGGHDEYPVFATRRSNNTFRNCCIQQTGNDRNGLETWSDAGDTVVEDSTVNVPGQVATGNVEEVNIVESDTCPVPSGVDPMPDQDETFDEPVANVPLSEAPLPGNASKLDYPVMGTDSDNPTLTVYGNFVYDTTQRFAAENLPKILSEYVVSGEMNVEFRSVAYPDDHYLNSVKGEVRIAQLALGTWRKNCWDDYWGLFEYICANEDSIEWNSYNEARDLLKRNDVRTYGWVTGLVENDEWEDDVYASRRAAADAGLSYITQVELDGDLAGANWRWDILDSWIDRRL